MTKLEFEARKVYLEQYISILRELDELEQEREELKYAIGPGAGSGSGMPGSSRVSDGSDRIIGRMDRMDKLEKLIDREEQALIRRRDEISAVLESVTNGSQREVLYYRYARDMDIAAIADKMNYSYRQIQNIHNRAIVRLKLPGRALVRIKAELMEFHPEWAYMQQKPA